MQIVRGALPEAISVAPARKCPKKCNLSRTNSPLKPVPPFDRLRTGFDKLRANGF